MLHDETKRLMWSFLLLASDPKGAAACGSPAIISKCAVLSRPSCSRKQVQDEVAGTLLSSCLALSDPLASPMASLVQHVGDYRWGASGRLYMEPHACFMMNET